LRVLFLGYSQLGYRAVKLLAELGCEVAAVVTHHDDPEERRWYRTPAEAAAELGLAVHYSDELAAAPGGVAAFAEGLGADLVLSVFYRDMLPQRVLAAARLAALNLHPSLLPAYRGRAPINWVLVNGERETGVTLHHMIGRADAGDIVGQRAIAIAPRETALSLYRKVEAEGVALLAEMLPRVAAGTAPRLTQDGTHASYFGRRRPRGRRHRLVVAGGAHRLPGARRGAAVAGRLRRGRRAARGDPPGRAGRAARCRGCRGGRGGCGRRGAGDRPPRRRAGVDRNRRPLVRGAAAEGLAGVMPLAEAPPASLTPEGI
jgi:folate-dependent phosphoribosylglycinamide formyltransferase PurN